MNKSVLVPRALILLLSITCSMSLFAGIKAQTTQAAAIPDEVKAIELQFDSWMEAWHERDFELMKVIKQDVKKRLDETKADHENHARWLVCMGRYLWYVDQEEEARANYVKAIQIAPQSVHVRESYITFLNNNWDSAEALVQKKTLFEMTKSAEHLEDYVVGIHHGNEYEKAWDFICKTVAEHPNNTAYKVVRGDFAYRQGRMKESLKIFEQLLQEDATLAVAHVGIGDVLYYQKKYESAKKNFKAALLLDEDLGDALVGLHQIALWEKNEKEAKHTKKRLYQLNDNGAYQASRFLKELIHLPGGYQVYIYEYFKLRGKRAMKYAFYSVEDDGKSGRTLYYISLGSYPYIEQNRPKGQSDEYRTWHLDYYAGLSHATLDMFKVKKGHEFEYKLLREHVLGIIKGENKRREVEAEAEAKELEELEKELAEEMEEQEEE